MRPYRDSRLTYILLSAFFVAVLGYAAFEARGIVLGPSITLASDATESAEAFVVLTGHAERIASLAMNGRAVAVTETGDFAIPYLLAPGYNRIVIDATDRYGRIESRVVEMVYTGKPLEETPHDASTSPAEDNAPSGASTTPLDTVAPSP